MNGIVRAARVVAVILLSTAFAAHAEPEPTGATAATGAEFAALMRRAEDALARNDSDGAYALYSQALEDAFRERSRAPEDPTYQLEAATALLPSADILKTRGDLGAAHNTYQALVGVSMGLKGDAPTESALRRYNGIAKLELAQLAGSRVKPDEVQKIWSAMQTDQILQPGDQSYLDRVQALVNHGAPKGPPVSRSDMGVLQPDWIRNRVPTSEQIFALFPHKALRDHVSGSARIRCRVLLDTTLTECVIVQEQPVGYNFGDAVLSLAKIFRMSPMKINGKPNDYGIVNIPIRMAQN
ncbi:MAG: hypothetical protein WA840_07665 [Caulobacteraceae bacterium]